jgi:hypothetical protein
MIGRTEEQWCYPTRGTHTVDKKRRKIFLYLVVMKRTDEKRFWDSFMTADDESGFAQPRASLLLDSTLLFGSSKPPPTITHKVLLKLPLEIPTLK